MTQPNIRLVGSILGRASSSSQAARTGEKDAYIRLGAELRRPSPTIPLLALDDTFHPAHFDRGPSSDGSATGARHFGLTQRLLRLEAKVERIPVLEREVEELKGKHEREVADLRVKFEREIADLKEKLSFLEDEIRTAREAAAERQTSFEESEAIFARIQEALGPTLAEKEDEPLDAETLTLLLDRGSDE
jgi:FtsZ-binding cell division protein ZapB